MSEQQTSVATPAKEYLSYSFGGNEAVFANTTSGLDSSVTKNPLKPKIGSTEGGVVDLGLRLVVDKAKVPAPAVHMQSRVPGVILNRGPVSVLCELTVGNRQVKVQLPQMLFQEDMGYGAPIFLELVEDGALRKPVISPREIDPAIAKNIAGKFQDIIDSI